MEHLENDMDDLFQKAGELYPLKTTGSDWDAVAGKLLNEGPGEAHDLPGLTAVRSGNKRKWLLLLLLIPLGLGITYYSGEKNPGHQITPLSKSNGSSADQVNDRNKIKSVTPGTGSSFENPAADNSKPKQADGIQNPSGNQHVTEISSTRLKQTLHKGKAITNAGDRSQTSKNILNSRKQESVAMGPMNRHQTKKSDSDKTGSDILSSDAGTASQESGSAITGGAAGAQAVSGGESAVKTPAAVIPVPTAQTQTAAKNETDKTDSIRKISRDSVTVTKKTNKDTKKSKGFYVSLFAGPDFSAVKFQGMHQVGSGLGLMLGYRFNQLAVETGLIWDKKYYYSSGEYFKNTPQSYYPPNTTFNGHCDMFEIPLLLRYDFSPEKKSGFFAKAGFSSYLMTRQYYSKKVNGIDSGSWPWTESANYFFSIVQVSGGYEFSIGAKTKIQVEPYIKIPLRGLGEGNMPISSAGIYFGITHSFR